MDFDDSSRWPVVDKENSHFDAVTIIISLGNDIRAIAKTLSSGFLVSKNRIMRTAASQCGVRCIEQT